MNVKIKFPFVVTQISETEVQVEMNAQRGKPFPEIDVAKDFDAHAAAWGLSEGARERAFATAQEAFMTAMVREMVQVQAIATPPTPMAY